MPRILVVDDEKAMRLLVTRSVRLPDVEWLLAASAAEARDHFQSAQPIAAAVIDKNLPDGTGLELIEDLKLVHPEAEAILITAFVTTQSLIEALRHGAFDYLPKPFDPMDLNIKVGNAVAKSELRQKVGSLLEQLREGSDGDLRDLARGVAHEINNPLAYVRANLEVLRDELQRLGATLTTDRRVHLVELFQDISEGVERMGKVVQTLRENVEKLLESGKVGDG